MNKNMACQAVSQWKVVDELISKMIFLKNFIPISLLVVAKFSSENSRKNALLLPVLFINEFRKLQYKPNLIASDYDK